MQLIRFLYVTNFVTGAVVMIIELLGTRFLAPYFGASLYVWTALITVTLVALAFGYSLGGHLADRWPKAQLLYSMIFAAGVFLMAILLVRQPILSAGATTNIMAGTLVSATILFGPPLLILGTVAPFSVKLCAKEYKALGTTVGRLYSISTVGSFVGTLAAGFLLLPTFPIVTILVFCSAALAVLAGVFFICFSRQTGYAVGAAAVVALALLTAYKAERLTAGTVRSERLDWKAIYQTNSFYGRIRVLNLKRPGDDDDSWLARTLLNDGLTQGRYDLRTKTPDAVFPYALTELALSGPAPPERVLLLGLGAGFVPRLLKQYGTEELICVEINPRMLDVAIRYFDFPIDPAWQETCRVVIEDARTWVKRCDQTFDAIVVDTFLGDNAPSHLLSYEMFAGIRRILEPDGVLAINIFGSMRGDGSRLIAALVRTLTEGPDGRGPFPFVQVFSEEALAVSHNVYILAAPTDRPKRKNGISIVRPPSADLDKRINEALQDQTALLEGVGEAPILLDDHNPAEYLDIAVRMRMRNVIRRFWGEALFE